MLPRYEAVLFGRVQAFVTTTEGLEMERLFRIANSYHRMTHCFPWKQVFRKPITYLFLLSIIGFPLSFLWAITSTENQNQYLINMLPIAIFQLIFMLAPYRIRILRNRYITNKFNRRFRKNFYEISDVKKYLIKRYFYKHNGNYQELITHITNSIEIYNKRHEPIDFLIFTYNALINIAKFFIKIVFITFPVAITIYTKSPSENKTLQEITKQLFLGNTILETGQWVFAIFFVLISTVYVITSTPMFFEKVFSTSNKKRRPSFYTLENLKHDLLLYSRIPEPKANKD